MSFNESSGLRVTETPELGPTMLRMDGAHNGPANELTLQWVLRELRQLRGQQKTEAAALTEALSGALGSTLMVVNAQTKTLQAQIDRATQQQTDAAQRQHDALTALLTQSVVGVVQALGDLGGLTAAAVVAHREAIDALRADLERRSFGGRCRRFWTWLAQVWR